MCVRESNDKPLCEQFTPGTSFWFTCYSDQDRYQYTWVMCNLIQAIQNGSLNNLLLDTYTYGLSLDLWAYTYSLIFINNDGFQWFSSDYS